jgi:hypothetical protein
MQRRRRTAEVGSKRWSFFSDAVGGHVVISFYVSIDLIYLAIPWISQHLRILGGERRIFGLALFFSFFFCLFFWFDVGGAASVVIPSRMAR